MKKLLIPLSVALAQMFAVGAFAQTKSPGGEANPSETKTAPAPKSSASAKADAKAMRKVEGKQAAKMEKPGEAAAAGTAGPAKKSTKEEKAAAKAKRKASAKEALEKGHVTR